MARFNKLFITGTLLLGLLLCPMLAAAFDWQPLQTGIDYLEFTPLNARLWSHVHVFRIDPKQYQLQLALAADHQSSSATVKSLAEHYSALIAVNGGFFAPDFKPLGLRIRQGVIRHPLKQTSWWGVFYIEKNQPKITTQSAFSSKRNISFAVQGGPRLLIDGKIPKLKPGIAERTALGITKSGKVIILATQNHPSTTEDLAVFMRDILNCEDALNLDGGSSTQLYANLGDFHLYISGYSNIADAVLVLKRE